MLNAQLVEVRERKQIGSVIERHGTRAQGVGVIDRSRQNSPRGTTGPRDADGGWFGLVRGDRF